MVNNKLSLGDRIILEEMKHVLAWAAEFLEDQGYWSNECEVLRNELVRVNGRIDDANL